MSSFAYLECHWFLEECIAKLVHGYSILSSSARIAIAAKVRRELQGCH